jgi:hypothetical protein
LALSTSFHAHRGVELASTVFIVQSGPSPVVSFPIRKLCNLAAVSFDADDIGSAGNSEDESS